MPLYEYQCDVCGRFEKIVKFSDPPLAACPTCGGTVQKLFSSPAIQFKGSGFYITDYAKKSSSESSEGKSSSGEKSAKSSGEKSSGDSSSGEKSSSDKSSGEKSSGEKSSSDKSSTPAAAATTSKD
jgi:putative FmdB family regulatory protein